MSIHLTPKQARLLHRLLVGMVTAGSVALINELQKLGIILTSGSVGAKSIIIGTVVAMASAGIGIWVANLNTTDTTNTPNLDNMGNK